MNTVRSKKTMGIVGLFAFILMFLILFGMYVHDEAEWDMGYISALALVSAMDIDPVLNQDMQYIAVDMDAMNPKERAKVIMYLKENYKVDVFEATMEKLEEDGLVNENGSLDGVLLVLESTEIRFANVYVEGYKYRSSIGAIGFKATVRYAGINHWKLKECIMTWIS